jgi:hypothetical protein
MVWPLSAIFHFSLLTTCTGQIRQVTASAHKRTLLDHDAHFFVYECLGGMLHRWLLPIYEAVFKPPDSSTPPLSRYNPNEQSHLWRVRRYGEPAKPAHEPRNTSTSFLLSTFYIT